MTASLNPLVLLKWNSRRTHSQADQNWQNCLRWAGNYNPGDTYVPNQIVFHEGGAWVCVAQTTNEPTREISTDWFPFTLVPGRGGMLLSAPNTTGWAIGAGWTPLTLYDTVHLQPYGVALDTVAGTWDHDFAGIWNESLFLAFQHNSSNQGRLTYIRLWNITTASELGRAPIGIGRNVEATNFAFTHYEQIGQAAIDDSLRWEIGGGDSITIDSFDNLNFSTIQISNY